MDPSKQTASAWIEAHAAEITPQNRADMIKRCRKETGKAMSTIREAMIKRFGVSNSPTLEAPAEVKRKTLGDFRKTFDIALRIREGIKRHLGGETYLSDTEFRERCAIHISRWRRYADEDEFRKNRYRFDGTLYWASESTMKQMKHIAGIPEEA
jgi:hypothetical protein